MKKKQKIPSEYRVALVVLFLFALVAGGSRIQKWVQEQRIRHRFEQAFAEFDEETMEFTIFYHPPGFGKGYEVPSTQAPPELRQAAQRFAHNLELYDNNGLSPYENGRKIQYQDGICQGYFLRKYQRTAVQPLTSGSFLSGIVF